jgi:hypothetical protein
MSSNQFYPNDTVPPGQFVGRTSELYTIFDQINNRGHALFMVVLAWVNHLYLNI